MSQIQTIKEATDIVQIINERVPLQRSGGHWRGLCPFHNEKSPSFFVNEQFQRYKCFGCGESGDVFTFLQKYEGMTFAESLKVLAERAGIELEQIAPDPHEAERSRWLSILDLAKEYYHYLLTEHEVGQPAREYLKNRGVSAESIKIFRLGYSVPNWDGLLNYLHGKKKFELSDIVATGLVLPGRTGRHYDRFRDRLMFPLLNHRGQVVGFSGRLLSSDAKEAKYINTPETDLYHKSKLLFGYSELYQAIRTKAEVVVVEGEFDVISSAQAHVNNVVAIKGSALTADHAQLLGRVAKRVLLSLDMDSAGVEATKRAIAIAKHLPIELRVIQIEGGKDPDDLARQDPAAWRQAVKSSISVYDFFLQAALKKHDASSPEGKRDILRELAPIWAAIDLVVEQEVYMKRLAEALETSPASIKADVKKISAGLPSQSEAKHTKTESDQSSSATKLENYVLFLLLRSPAAQLMDRLRQLDVSWFDFPAARMLIEHGQHLHQIQSTQDFLTQLPADIQKQLFDLYLDPVLNDVLENVNIADEWPAKVAALKVQATHAELVNLSGELRRLEAELESSPDSLAQYQHILQRVADLQRKLKQGA